MNKIKKNNLTMNLIFLTLTIFFFLLTDSNSIASQLPRYLGKEKKIRMFIYNPYDVYRYTGNYNYQGFIEFQSGAKQREIANSVQPVQSQQTKVEEVLEVAIGNSDAWMWKISDSKNQLYLKPVDDNANTNMTVKTSLGRIYNFELLARTPNGPDDENLIYTFKFVYPDDSDKNILEFPKTTVSDIPDMRDLSVYNFNYEFTGEPTIAPIKIFDNGEFTYMQFPHKNAEFPAVFSVDSEGFESLVNFRVAGDYMVIERVASQFTLRNGSEIVCIYNNNLFKNGKVIPEKSKNNNNYNQKQQNNKDSTMVGYNGIANSGYNNKNLSQTYINDGSSSNNINDQMSEPLQ